jgi:sulfur relay (sulfurtransferase) DsrF/TusC family protein
MVKSVIIISEQSPVGKNSAREALRLAAGFLGLGEEINCKVVLMGDAVYLMNKYAEPQRVGIDSLEEPLEMADLSDLEIYLVKEALEEAGLTEKHLVDYENLKIIDLEILANLIEEADTSFRF